MGNETAGVIADQTLIPSFARALAAEGYSLMLCGYSALDQYWGFPSLPFVWAETEAGIPELARLCDDLRFPGMDLADGAADFGDERWYFRCRDAEDPGEAEQAASYGLLSLTQDWTTKRFQDPRGQYPLLRELRDGKPGAFSPEASAPWWAGLNPAADRGRALMDGALILARYGAEEDSQRAMTELGGALGGRPPGSPPQAEAQRTLLISLLVSPRPDLGMEFLKAAGFVEKFWPELARLDNVDHSKEFHPEGNVWKHTLETFRYRKAAARNQGPGSLRAAYDLRLSLALLLHDVGKPLAESSGSRRFDGHAELGARAARKFLERLEFAPALIEDIFYLVKNHMLPAALPRLPLTRTGEIMESPLFSTLMELYRCDESSSFKGLDGYYESSAAYQAYLRHRRNPYRSADGKKLGKGNAHH
jgi:poly(A) polymerase